MRQINTVKTSKGGGGNNFVLRSKSLQRDIPLSSLSYCDRIRTALSYFGVKAKKVVEITTSTVENIPGCCFNDIDVSDIEFYQCFCFCR